VEAVELGLALAELDIDAGFGKSVVARDGQPQLCAIDRELAGKRFERVRANKIPARFQSAKIAAAGIDGAKTVAPDEDGVTDEISRDRGLTLVRLEHRQHEIVVGACLVDETAGRRVDRD